MIEVMVVHFTLTLVRVAAFVAFLPPTAGRHLPNTVKIGLAIALTGIFAMPTGPSGARVRSEANGPAVAERGLSVGQTPAPRSVGSYTWLLRAADAWPAFALLALRETFYGIGLALCFGLVLMPARMAGSYIAQEMGLSIATLTGTADDQQTSIVGAILETVAALLFFALNLHLAVIAFLDASFRRFPAGTASWELSPGWIISSVTGSIETGLLIAAPVGIVLMLTLVGLLVLMRSVPQFNLFSVGMSIRLVAGLGALLVFAPETFVLIRHSLSRMMPFW